MVASPSSEPMVDFELYDKQETIDNFENILPHFRRDLALTHNVIVKSTAAQLSSFTAKFQHFQYRILGTPSAIQEARSSFVNKKAKSSSPINSNENSDDDDNNNGGDGEACPPCLPPLMFRTDNLNPMSPLYIILETAYAHQPDDSLWDLESHRRRDEYLELTRTMYERLEEAGLYDPPRLILLGLTDQDGEKKEQAIAMVNDLKGKLVDRIDQATHVVHFSKNDEKDDGKRVTSKMVRILESDDGNSLVHWYRYPDSYNEWLNEKKIKDNKRVEEEEDDAPAASTGAPDDGNGPLYVQSSWLTDGYKFNTWMDPQDYKCPPHIITGLKRRMEETGGLSSNIDQGNNDYDSDSVSNNKRFRSSNDTNGDKTNGANDIQEQARRHLSTQQFEVIIPSYAAWFEFDQIHKTERLALPEFFNGVNQTKSPVAYMDFRNFMVNTYRLNPLEYLTVTACRRNLPGDVCAIIRIHGFLEKWGLINYQIDPTLKMSNIGPPFSGNFTVVMEMPHALRPAVQKPRLITIQHEPTDPNSTPSESTPSYDKPLTAPNDTSSSSASRPATKKIDLNLELRQSVYPLVDLPSSKQQPSLTNDTTSNGHHIESTQSSRSEQHDDKVVDKEDGDGLKTTTDRLTDQQKVLLLEGMEMFDNDWNAVAEHTGLSKEDCISHYLQLPLEDPYVDLDIMQSGIDRFAKQQQHKRLGDDDPLVLVVDFLKENADSDHVAAHVSASSSDNVDPINNNSSKNDTKLAHDLIKNKVALYKKKMGYFMELEAHIEQERQLLEQERHQLGLDRLEIRKKEAQITGEILRRRAMNGSMFSDTTKEGNTHRTDTPPPPSLPSSSPSSLSHASLTTAALASAMSTNSPLHAELP
ncbi:hypothetical protein [Absidia glauca]|uniref:SWIRM domain-containing protein n=1 Tax=Absidia glauca TaxID=4829 RepID=A0A163K7W6_ABSGL|nr:hypothetical protein [Absidia glauca]